MPIPFRAARAALPLFLSVAIACAFALAPVGRAQTIDPIVLYAGDVDVQAGAIARATSSTGAGGYKMTSADAGWESLSSPSSQPVHYFEIPFDATGKKWVRFAAWDVAGNGAMVQPVRVGPAH